MRPGPVERADLVVVGAGPAGAATALGALHADPSLSVVLLDRAEFPRDKPCGDGVAPHVLDLLAEVGVTGLLEDRVPVRRLRLQRGDLAVDRAMDRPAWVVPRAVLDARLVEAARAAGADLRRHRVRAVRAGPEGVVVDDRLVGRLLVGADGAHSQVRASVAGRSGATALALRGYAPTPPGRAGHQTIVFGTERQPSYAWSFDCGDGTSNVGYGELLGRQPTPPTRVQLLHHLEELLPGATSGGRDWRGHHLPLSGARPLRPGRGRVLLAGDAAGLVNPLTGEGIYYAVATGLLAGRTAARALAAGRGDAAAATYTTGARRLLGRHLRHTALASRLTRHDAVLRAGLEASRRDQRAFDDLVELGLAQGTLTPALGLALLRSLSTRARSTRRPPEESPACES